MKTTRAAAAAADDAAARTTTRTEIAQVFPGAERHDTSRDGLGFRV